MNNIDLLLINVKFPENVGMIYRLAIQFNVRHIYRYNCSVPGKTNTYKTEKHIPITDVLSLDFLKNYPHPKYLLETGGQILKKKPDNVSHYLLAVGNESYGVADEDKVYFDEIYTLQAPRLISYNVSAALAIGLYYFTY
ncbi:hypothetical protein A3F06_03925 [candidate division TM6 bacterium RIFCSPHIGHO2_12_FULL_36_22]|nr:MAG: hypothetical protein A3F06_03925 [candidate division TM6 bacterium RIFCSPHIGHO2_12_FULL_36_22]